MESGIYIRMDDNGLRKVDLLFGGKIGVVSAYNDTQTAVCFHELDFKHLIGESDPEELIKDEFQIRLIFNNIKSIEVVENALKKAKENLIERDIQK